MTEEQKQMIKERENFRVSVKSLFDLEGITNDNLANLITNNFEYYASSLQEFRSPFTFEYLIELLNRLYGERGGDKNNANKKYNSDTS